jgi:hypothetical protein
MTPLLRTTAHIDQQREVAAFQVATDTLHKAFGPCFFDAKQANSFRIKLLVNPPGYAPAAFVLLAELHGRIGHFPSLVRLRPKSGPVTTYEVAELLNLQTIRDAARERR